MSKWRTAGQLADAGSELWPAISSACRATKEEKVAPWIQCMQKDIMYDQVKVGLQVHGSKISILVNHRYRWMYLIKIDLVPLLLSGNWRFWVVNGLTSHQ